MSIIIQKEFHNIKDYINEVINQYLNDYHLDIPYSTKENLSIHLSLSISRLLSNSFISYSESQLIQCKNLETYPIAKKIISSLEEHFCLKMDKNDIYYTAMYLSNLSLLDLDFDISSDIVGEDVEKIMNEALLEIKDKLGYDLKQHKEFYNGITLHFYPAIERLKTNQQLDSNPLSDITAIKDQREFQCAEILNDIVEKYYSKSFNDNELGYIILHFGTAFYKQA